MMVSKSRMDYSISEGNKAEDKFSKLMTSRGNSCVKSSKYEDIYKHIDLKLYVFNPNKGHEDVISVDVKAQKKTNRPQSWLGNSFHVFTA